MTIFGYSFDEIKRAQQGWRLAKRLPQDVTRPLATEDDFAMLEKYGMEELRNRALYGVLDRLANPKSKPPADNGRLE